MYQVCPNTKDNLEACQSEHRYVSLQNGIKATVLRLPATFSLVQLQACLLYWTLYTRLARKETPYASVQCSLPHWSIFHWKPVKINGLSTYIIESVRNILVFKLEHQTVEALVHPDCLTRGYFVLKLNQLTFKEVCWWSALRNCNYTNYCWTMWW